MDPRVKPEGDGLYFVRVDHGDGVMTAPNSPPFSSVMPGLVPGIHFPLGYAMT